MTDHGPPLEPMRISRLMPTAPELRHQPVRLTDQLPPTLLVIIDTEEDFDWGKPFARHETRADSIQYIDRVQRIFERYGVRPTYVIDYPIAVQPRAYERLRDMVGGGVCTVGAHIHPWVNPPHEEEVNARNSFLFNLPQELQRAKLRALIDCIEQNVGVTPTIFKAGRYGIGLSTIPVLEELGFDVDTSINPRMDFSDEGGPSFEAFDAAPFFFGRTRRLLELPCTTGYTGIAGDAGVTLHRWAETAMARRMRAAGVLSRLGIVSRIQLSPEGHSLHEMKALTRALLAAGLRTFTVTLHSPSVVPGNTPYVQTLDDLESFLSCLDSYCDFFFRDLQGAASTPQALRTLIEQSTPDSFAELPHHAGVTRL